MNRFFRWLLKPLRHWVREQANHVFKYRDETRELDRNRLAWSCVARGLCPCCFGSGVDHVTTADSTMRWLEGDEEARFEPSEWRLDACHSCKGDGVLTEEQRTYWTKLFLRVKAKGKARSKALPHPLDAGLGEALREADPEG